MKFREHSVPSYFYRFLTTHTKDLVTAKVVIISENSIPDDVMERIFGYEVVDQANESSKTKVYGIGVLGGILANKEDDTNETTKIRIEFLYKKIKKFDFFVIK